MTKEFLNSFGPFHGRTWLNCAHQGPLPRIAAKEARKAVNWKVTPHKLTTEQFNSIPARLKNVLARLIGASSDEIILGNSASYGLHLLANGIPWRQGDEVLVVAGDFPSNIFPWLQLKKYGVNVRFLHPRNPLPEPDELRRVLTSKTRLFCTSWVHSFTGYAADLSELGSVCRQNDVTFAINASQALGARPLDVGVVPVDFVTCVGFKWLCGPYGTGFCWIKPNLLTSLQYNQAYWLTEMTADDLSREELEVRLPKGPPSARTYDVFGTANFFNFMPWTTSIEYLLGQGIEQIADYDQRLVSQIIEELENDKYNLLSPSEVDARSTLIFISHKNSERNAEIHSRLKEQGIDVALRRGWLRLSPHLYNTKADIDRILDALSYF